MMAMNVFSYPSMGCEWKVTIWDEIQPSTFREIEKDVISASRAFDQAYSRFISNSLVWELTKQKGVLEVPTDLVTMLRMYHSLWALSKEAFTPLIGYTLSDLGYDAEYSLQRQKNVRPVPRFDDALRIIDDTHIEIIEPCLIDIGAMGKGFFVDRISSMLRSRGVVRFLVDGSGDIYYQGNGEKIRAGLEHPGDATKVVGALEISQGGFCASGGNGRVWNGHHHIIDPVSLTSPPKILSTWVLAESAAIADGLATCLFLAEPEQFEKDFIFEYCILRDDYKVRRSPGFTAELF
jgi:thiamine biosynthesis lipoprotein